MVESGNRLWYFHFSYAHHSGTSQARIAMRLVLIKEPSVSGISRRSFVGQVATGVAAMAAVSSTSDAQLVYRLSEWNVKDFDRLVKTPAHVRQVYDVTGIEHGLFLNAIKNSLNGLHFGFDIPESQIQIVAALHGPANAVNYDDYVWSKYRIGEWLNVEDSKTGKPAERNMFYPSNAGKDMQYASSDPNDENSLYQDGSVQALQSRGVKFLSCHTALEEQARILVHRLKLSESSEMVVKDMMSHALPGVLIVPSMVASLALLQNRGHYAYMRS
jgi:intracellular sulfur oxidation DsrE/DsrF family protein